jgi:hypothetical protein
VLGKQAVIDIAFPVYGYLKNSASGQSALPFLMEHLGKFLNLENCTAAQAQANDAAYFRKRPQRTNTIDTTQIAVEKVQWSGDACYMVTMPYDWTVRNGKKFHSGHATALAYVMPGHYLDNKAAYFITSLWNYKTN